MSNIIIQNDQTFLNEYKNSLESNQSLVSWELFQLLYQYKKATFIRSFDELQALKYLPHIEFLPHQLEAAQKVIAEMHGRALLADEVGLGKTVEAGLILKEYMVRGLIKKALILVPASLVSQWINELHEKFYISATAYRKNYQWDQFPIIVTSIDLAKKEKHRQQILKIDYDLVIVDEAHKLKNHQTMNYEFINAVRKKYCLLLTATPMQNNLIELFNLVSIIRPGYLGNMHEFREEYMKNKEKNSQYLQRIIQNVMVRHRRKETLLDNIKRKIHTIWLQFSEAEQQVYDQLEELLRTSPSFSKIIYLKEFCSSREACYFSLQRSKDTHIKKESVNVLKQIETLPHHQKANKVLEILRGIGNEKAIIFTEYRATQDYLYAFLYDHQIPAVCFYGGLKQGRKDWIRQLFEHNARVLIATEAGGEGINLQFCNHIINYDLPWNPMRIEQRIGRVHRYGQLNDVHVYNFAIKKTIEEQIMSLLYAKIDIFERAVGRLDDILALLNGRTIDQEIEEIFNESTSIGEIKIKTDNLMHVFENLTGQRSEYNG